jgi:hypothetical protein
MFFPPEIETFVANIEILVPNIGMIVFYVCRMEGWAPTGRDRTELCLSFIISGSIICLADSPMLRFMPQNTHVII